MCKLLPALALSMLVVASASATTFDSPGKYPASLIASSAMIPPEILPPGTPVVGPTVYEGEFRIQRSSKGFRVRFQGVSQDGYRINVKANFDPFWAGVTTSLLPVGGSLVDAIVDIDPLHLTDGQVNGTVEVDGFERRVQASVGTGGVLLDLRIH